MTERVWKKSYFRKSLIGLYAGILQKALKYTLRRDNQTTSTNADNLVLYPMAIRIISAVPTKFWTIWKKSISNLSRVRNIKTRRIRPLNCMYCLGLFSPREGSPANKLFPSALSSAKSSNTPPANAKFLWKRSSIKIKIFIQYHYRNYTPVLCITVKRFLE